MLVCGLEKIMLCKTTSVKTKHTTHINALAKTWPFPVTNVLNLDSIKNCPLKPWVLYDIVISKASLISPSFSVELF